MGDDSRALRHARLRTGNQPARRPACAEAAYAPVAFRFLKMPQKSAGRRPDASQKLILLSLKEWCAYLTNDAKAWQIVLRFFILFLMLALAIMIGLLTMVVSMEHSVMHHQCEKNYVLWPQAVANLVLYSMIFLTYFIIQTDWWARITGAVFSLLAFAMVAWWAICMVRMAHICVTFYSIKYPTLHSFFYLCGPLNMVLLISFGVRECAVGWGLPTMSDEEEDATLITKVFYKQNSAYVPSLFKEEKINSYNKGVTEWSKCVDDRNTSLKETLSKASKIHEQSRNQSQLLNQLTDVVKEAETKVTKTEKLMQEQDGLIMDLKGTVDDLGAQLNGMGTKTTSFSVGGKTSDAVKWVFLSLMCCVTVALILLSLPKWLHLFGISFGITI